MPDTISPHLARAADGLGLQLRPETDADLEFLARLYATIRADEPGVVDLPPDFKAQFLAQQFTAQYAHYSSAYRPVSDFRIIERGGQPIGRLYLYVSSDDVRIVDIAFLPDFRRQGLGTALLSAVIDDARAGGRSASIHVEQFNPAQHLYRRLGFRDVHLEGTYILMRCDSERRD